MSTDGTAIIELLAPRPPFNRVPCEWATIHLARDYLAFELLAGVRSGDASVAVVPPRRVRWEGATDEDPDSAWLWAHEVTLVADAYRAQTDKDSADLRAIAAAMQHLGGAALVRVSFRFF